MIKNNTKIKSFCEKYYVTVRNENRRCAKYVPPTHYRMPIDDPSQISAIQFDTEPLVTVEIPLSKLEALVDLESTFYNNIEDVYSRRLFEDWMREQSVEKQLRNNHPTVKAAYEQYQATLDWCRTSPKTFKDL